MQRLDARLIEWLEKWCHKFQRLTGKTHYAILQVLFVVMGMSIIAVSSGLLFGFERDIFGLIVGTIMLFCSFFVPILENRAYKRIREGLANPEKLHWELRYTFLVFAVFFTALIILFPPIRISVNFFEDVFVLIIPWLSVVIFYLNACDPIPPCDGKVKEWLRNTFGKRAEI